MVIRWLGAYGKSTNLAESLTWELTQTERSELAASPCHLGDVAHCNVGLLVARRAVIRIYSGDAWTVKGEDGTLRKTRRPDRSAGHGEAIVRPEYRGIVVRWDYLSSDARAIVARHARLYRLPILDLCYTWENSKLQLREVNPA